MKLKTFLFALTIAMTSSFSDVSAQNEKKDNSNITKFEEVQISYRSNDLVHLEYLDIFAEGRRKMEVRFYEESGKLLYSERLYKKGDVKRAYDISQFPAGDYTFELFKNRVLVCSKAIVKDASIANADKESNIKPDIAKFKHVQISYKSNDLIHLEYLDIFAEGRRKMEVRFYEESGKLLYSERLYKKGDVKRAYDISQFPAGDYTFELFKNRVSIYSKDIVKQASIGIANTESKLNGREYSTNLLVSKN